MIQIKTKGETLDLPSGFTISIEDSNPIFNDRGSQSIPVSVPVTLRNIRILDAPHRIDAGIDPNFPERTVEIADGAYIRRGMMNITEAGKEQGITFNVGFDNSTAYAKWTKKKLAELSGLPTFHAPESQGYPIDNLLDELYRIYRNPDPRKDDFAVFPVAVNNESTGTDDDKQTYWEVLNVAGNHGFAQPTKVKRLIDGEVTEVSVPEGYMVTPFLRVWRVLDLIFADMGLEIISNPFFRDIELSRLVVLNNAADSVCRAEIKYSDLMPDSTVEEFLNALWVRFGLVYNIDNNTGTVRLEFIKDIIGKNGNRNLDTYISGTPKIIYEERQYVKLSANTSIEGAKPSHERFEDFVKNLDLSNVHLGNHVSQWQNKGTQEIPRWDGDWIGDYDPWEDYDPPEPPEPPEPEYPDPYDYDDSRNIESQQSEPSETTADKTFLAREFVTGLWYRLDASNGTVRLSSSSFFNWDPQPEGLTPLELTSDDEFVPVIRVSTVGLGVGNTYNDLCPLYLFGARHYHSYIKGSDETESSGDNTPLAFMFAYTTGNKTIGRITPEGDDGKPLTLDDGTKPYISLLFQFKDGLFAKFWADYDEILRHGNRSIEVKTIISKNDLLLFNLLDAYTFRGIRMLIDTMNYTLPSGRDVSVDLKLRTIQTHGNYNINEEQNIPEFSAGARHLEWKLLEDDYGDNLDTWQAKNQAANNYISCYEYHPHGTDGDYWYVGPAGAVLKSMSRLQPTWEDDKSLPRPNNIYHKLTRTYKARLIYDIYEIHDMTVQGGSEDYELSEEPLGIDEASVEYTVVLVPYWVAD